MARHGNYRLTAEYSADNRVEFGITQANVDEIKSTTTNPDIKRFLGITDVRIVRAEGLNMGPEVKAEALASAEKDLAAALA